MGVLCDQNHRVLHRSDNVLASLRGEQHTIMTFFFQGVATARFPLIHGLGDGRRPTVSIWLASPARPLLRAGARASTPESCVCLLLSTIQEKELCPVTGYLAVTFTTRNDLFFIKTLLAPEFL